jgi:hypothetical protein
MLRCERNQVDFSKERRVRANGVIIIIITFTWSGPSGVLGCTGQRP